MKVTMFAYSKRTLLAYLMTVAALLIAASASATTPAKASPECKTIKGVGASDAQVCVTPEREDRGLAIHIDGAEVEALSTDNPYGADEFDVYFEGAQAFDAGLGEPVLLTTANLSREGVGSNDCDYDHTTTFWSLFARNGAAWEPLLSVEARSDYNAVRCREDDGMFNNNITLDLIPITLDAPMIFATSQQLMREPGDPLEAEVALKVWIYDATERAFVSVSMDQCPAGATPDPAIKNGGVSCLDDKGERHGPQKTLHRNKDIASQSWYHHGKRVGAFVKWHDNGQPSLIGLYDAQGVAQQRWVAYHDNGQPRKDEVYANDKRVSGEYFNDKGASISFEQMNIDKKKKREKKQK